MNDISADPNDVINILLERNKELERTNAIFQAKIFELTKQNNDKKKKSSHK